MGIRSFLAFELPAEIKEIVSRVSGELRQSSLDARWVRVDKIHITVVFMGNVPAEDIPGIKEMAQRVCLQYRPFEAALKGIGCFPNPRSARVLWIGLQADLERLTRFRDALQQGLKAFGIKEEKRAFKPHLTLARFRRPKKRDPLLDQVLSRHQALSSPVCPLKELILFRSDLKPSGAEYTKLETWPLTGDK